MSLPYVLAWARAFVATVGVELVIAGLLMRAYERRTARRLVVVALANAATHPAVWFLFPRLGASYVATMTLAEAWAFGFEAVVYARVFEGAGKLRAIACSAFANAASFAVGLVLAWLVPWA